MKYKVVIEKNPVYRESVMMGFIAPMFFAIFLVLFIPMSLLLAVIAPFIGLAGLITVKPK